MGDLAAAPGRRRQRLEQAALRLASQAPPLPRARRSRGGSAPDPFRQGVSSTMVTYDGSNISARPCSFSNWPIQRRRIDTSSVSPHTVALRRRRGRMYLIKGVLIGSTMQAYRAEAASTTMPTVRPTLVDPRGRASANVIVAANRPRFADPTPPPLARRCRTRRFFTGYVDGRGWVDRRGDAPLWQIFLPLRGVPAGQVIRL